MSTKYTQKLEKLRQRRNPTGLVKSLESYVLDSADGRRTATASATPITESYERKGKGDAARYALGCMAEVAPEYTAISIMDAKRVRTHLEEQTEHEVTTRLQGSVPLNIHIYASSDVDVLVLADWFRTVASPIVSPSKYNISSNLSPLNELQKLRGFCEKLLEEKYPAANVDTSGAKSIAISGGSLARKVDVVPAHWVDSVDYQKTGDDATREVSILDKAQQTRLKNRPFLHMARIEEKDSATEGSAKHAIRLLKCLSRDSDNDIKLSSYDIASLVFHMDTNELKTGAVLPLQLLNRVEVYLRFLEANPPYAKSLQTPDGTRKVLDSTGKINSLSMLRQELTDAIENVAGEYNPELMRIFDRARAAEAARRTLDETVITG
ncbi:TPA: hypothetical protein QDB08_002689 [Burkholderia vietnamiensis]|uniref:hypothetical protein n=1 Tax=Burkholderia vietnamiensis TaxID=60552 RepID=UPI001593C242|nr:hypothetical protein [Burkholderia vietnamiensis]HDR9009719.1 hypothetical protein [Burkholderia vietnamiensis]HDR9013764.1 hypothetical protein [Burkholderia vietnamiensis]